MLLGPGDMNDVFALATPPSKSAICVFRVSGNTCLKKISVLFGGAEKEFNRFYLSSLYCNGVVIDKVGLVVFKGPNSYTGEDSFEVFAHGSLGVMSKIIEAFRFAGLEEAKGGEFTKRAFLNNKISLNEAESVADLIDSTDGFGVSLAGRSLFGELSKRIILFTENIDSLRTRVEAEIDFSDEGNEYFDEGLVGAVKKTIEEFESFLSACVNKKALSMKNNVLLLGPVNSGKSSIFNRLLGYERAIVSNVPGTTRDLVESEMFYQSSSFRVVDSAGIRKTDDLVEKAGINNTVAEINQADLIICVFESFDKDEMNYFKNLCGDKSVLCVQNKIDSLEKESFFDCCVSAKSGEGFDNLKKLISSLLNENNNNSDYKFLIRERHEVLLSGVIKSLRDACVGFEEDKPLELIAEDLKIARDYLDEVVGKKFSDSLLGDIFNSYCIGK